MEDNFLNNEEEKKDREDFIKIKEYMRNHPLSNAMEIASATGIAVNKITKFIQQGALVKK